MTNENALATQTPQAVDASRGADTCVQVFQPDVDILETADELLVLADLPGVKLEDIDINFEDGRLTIHGPAKQRQPADTRYVWREFTVGAYCRSFRIGKNIDASKISAEFANGVLTLHLPKVEAARPRRIAVSAGANG